MDGNRRRGLRAALRTPTGLACGVLLVLFVLLAILGPLIWGAAADQRDIEHLLEGGSAAHPFGTDNLGRDNLARLLVAAGPSLALAALSIVVAAVLGIPLGALPAVLGRRAARAVTAVIDFMVAFPALLLAIFLAVVLGVGAPSAVLAIGVAGAPSIARLTQTLAASVAGSDYVAAAALVGVPRGRVLLRHLLPNVAEPLILNLTLAIGQALLVMSGLSFLGLGVQAPSYDWGRMLSEGLGRIYVSPAAALGPGIAIVLAGLAFNGLGEALAEGVRGRPARVSRPTPPPPEHATDDADPVLTVSGLTVTFPGGLTPVRGVDFTLGRGELVGIVGESGSGKSLTALALAQLVPESGVVTADSLRLLGRDLRQPANADTRRLLGTSLAMMFQDPGTSLNPSLLVGRQLAEVAEVHRGQPRASAWRLAVDRLRAVRIANPQRRARQYPHELSGGMRQRAVIGMGLMGEPKLIIADEPTSALDVTVQQQILRLLRQVNTDRQATVLVITHDIAMLGQLVERVLVMYAGSIVEDLPTRALGAAAHPYTRALVASVPDLASDRDQPLATIPGRPPLPHEIGAGCPFAARCDRAGDRCRTDQPPLRALATGHRVACWHPHHTENGSRP